VYGCRCAVPCGTFVCPPGLTCTSPLQLLPSGDICDDALRTLRRLQPAPSEKVGKQLDADMLCLQSQCCPLPDAVLCCASAGTLLAGSTVPGDRGRGEPG
jgi:hypothetical protein